MYATGTLGVVRSLNLGVRKRETERIEHENHQFAKRLFDRSPEVDHTRLDSEYKQTLEYRGRLKKVELQLPPINQKKMRSTRRHKTSRAIHKQSIFEQQSSENKNTSQLTGQNLHQPTEGSSALATNPNEQQSTQRDQTPDKQPSRQATKTSVKEPSPAQEKEPSRLDTKMSFGRPSPSKQDERSNQDPSNLHNFAVEKEAKGDDDELQHAEQQ